MDSDVWVRAVRRDLEEEFAPRIERALARWPVELDEIDIAGVSCLAVTPAGEAPGQARSGDGLAGTVLYFFGGGYVSGSPETDLPIIAALSCLGPVRVVAPRYALAPEQPFPVAFEQASAVYAALEGLLGVAGESAGGGLALSLLSQPIPPRRLALFSPWLDMTQPGLAAVQDDPTLSKADLVRMAEVFLNGADGALASPGVGRLPDPVPPMFLTTGTQDILRAQVTAFHRRLTAVGASSTLQDAPDMWHVFEAYDECPAAEASLRTAARFLRT